jgi:hypothetical protein
MKKKLETRIEKRLEKDLSKKNMEKVDVTLKKAIPKTTM